jgi:hypothetical protein
VLVERRVVLAGILAFGLSGCASMTSSKEDLRDIAENEGVVFGSFLIDLDPGEEDGSAWEFWKGQKAGDATYAAEFTKTGLNPIKPRYSLRATPEQEAVFIKKLPAGQYQVEKVMKEGFTNLELKLKGVTFRVAPGQTTYIGKLTLQFPSRIMTGTPVRVSVRDTQQETTEALRDEYRESLSNAVKELITVR